MRIVEQRDVARIVVLVDCGWQSVEHQEVQVIDELLELGHGKVAKTLVVVELENLVGFLRGLIAT